MRAASRRKATAFGLLLGALAGVGGALGVRALTRPHPPAPTQSTPSLSSVRTPKPNAEALALWRKTLAAANSVPVHATVEITRPRSRDAKTILEIVEGTGGRYRLDYRAPETARGRTVLFDGTLVWQYEPARNVVLQRPRLAPNPASDSPLIPDASLEAARRFPEMEADEETVAGRPTRCLLLRDAAIDGRVVERRWIDRETGRTLRTDAFDDAGRLLRRVAMTRVAFGETPPESAFRANFPSTVRVIRTENASAQTARRVGLPARVGRLRLRSATPPSKSEPTTHLIYSSGGSEGDSGDGETVSVFIAPIAAEDETGVGPDWSQIVLGDRRNAFVRREPDPKTAPSSSAIAWIESGHRYVAVARMPETKLVEIVRTLASSR